MRVLVTGASGFVGRETVRTLAQRGHEVRAASRRGIGIPGGVGAASHGDISDIDWSRMLAGCDAVVHLAGIAHISAGIPEASYDRINHQATRALAHAAAREGIKRFVLVSSIRAQSGPTADHVLTEDEQAHPTDAYGRSKLAAERAVEETLLPYTILRPVVVYGPGAKGNVATLLRLAALPMPLPFGALPGRRSLVSLAALVDTIDFSLQYAPPRQTYIVADRAPVSLPQMIAALRHGLGRPPGLFPVPPSVLRLLLRLAGKADLLERIDGDLIASPAKLIEAGWRGATDSAAALEHLARATVSAGR